MNGGDIANILKHGICLRCLRKFSVLSTGADPSKIRLIKYVYFLEQEVGGQV